MGDQEETVKLDADRVAWCEVGNEVVILDLQSSKYFDLNHTARRIWKRLDTGATPNDLVEDLIATYGVPRQRAVADVNGFIDLLRERSLLLNEQPPPTGEAIPSGTPLTEREC